MIASPLARWFKPAADSAVAQDLRRGRSPWTHAIHLLWSIWLFITPLMGGGEYNARWFALTFASYPLFLLLYAKTLFAPTRSAWWYPLGMVALCLLLMRWYPSGLSYFVFGCVMLGAVRNDSLQRYLSILLLLNAVLAVVGLRLHYPWQVLAWLLPMTMTIGVITRIEAINQDKDAALRLSQDEVRRLAATAERERIGRDLHDLLGHTLSLITLKLELARKLAERDPPASRLHMEEAERVAREALAEVRSAVTGIRSSNLAAELASARLMLESSHVHLDYDAPPQELPPEVERGLALLLREAVTNIARHAQASCARIEFVREAKTVQLCVGDDGRGGVDADGNGLAGMRDRVRALGGTLSVDSPRGGGTRVLVRVPLAWREPIPPLRAVPDALDATANAGARA
ncbi:sensor histidine kinase [Thermomonas sp. HDW16]|uniref:sensor histidine kinase n=1 Tax=Thermomonas sp. HDW16 TaxID=2714945 RepID=UPI00140996EB|nr:sensor histidine kinase [Thermomonas sp. HDW16]QIL21626.1 sensor histidine kinase [Thermomonas sp. HDW16]